MPGWARRAFSFAPGEIGLMASMISVSCPQLTEYPLCGASLSRDREPRIAHISVHVFAALTLEYRVARYAGAFGGMTSPMSQSGQVRPSGPRQPRVRCSFDS